MRNQRRTNKPKFNNVSRLNSASGDTCINNVRIEVPVKFNPKMDEATKEKMIDVLGSEVLKLINVNIFALRSDVNNDPESKGNVIVGNFIEYNKETNTVTVDIYETFKNVIEDLEDKIAYVLTSYNAQMNITKINRIIIEKSR